MGFEPTVLLSQHIPLAGERHKPTRPLHQLKMAEIVGFEPTQVLPRLRLAIGHIT